jgi:hypothetical protein
VLPADEALSVADHIRHESTVGHSDLVRHREFLAPAHLFVVFSLFLIFLILIILIFIFLIFIFLALFVVVLFFLDPVLSGGIARLGELLSALSVIDEITDEKTGPGDFIRLRNTSPIPNLSYDFVWVVLVVPTNGPTDNR